MILRMTPMLPSIPLEKRGFLRRMGFMEGTGFAARSATAFFFAMARAELPPATASAAPAPHPRGLCPRLPAIRDRDIRPRS